MFGFVVGCAARGRTPHSAEFVRIKAVVTWIAAGQDLCSEMRLIASILLVALAATPVGAFTAPGLALRGSPVLQHGISSSHSAKGAFGSRDILSGAVGGHAGAAKRAAGNIAGNGGDPPCSTSQHAAPLPTWPPHGLALRGRGIGKALLAITLRCGRSWLDPATASTLLLSLHTRTPCHTCPPPLYRPIISSRTFGNAQSPAADVTALISSLSLPISL